MAYGKAIELFLVNGTADSLITAELSNWNGKAIKIPRTEVAACDRDDIKGVGGFTVLEGSIISDHTVPSLEMKGKTYFKLRNNLIKDGVIVDRAFSRDYEFNAPSAASAVILGHTSNGNVDWKTSDGTKLKDL